MTATEHTQQLSPPTVGNDHTPPPSSDDDLTTTNGIDPSKPSPDSSIVKSPVQPAQGDLSDVRMTGTSPAVVEDMLDSDALSPEASVAADGAANIPPTANGINGHPVDKDGDVAMEPTPIPPPDTPDTSHIASQPAAGSASPSRVGPDDDAKPPPAKRARKLSDADQASIANTGSPPPTSTSIQTNGETVVWSPPSTMLTPSQSGTTTLSAAQYRFCMSTIRSLKKLKEAAHFLHPVDPVALNIPHYPSIIKNPMDLGTIERKLMSSNPTKPDPNSNNPRYSNADEFISDVRLIFTNCLTFNGPDHIISIQGKNVETVFDKQIKQLPSPAVVKPTVVKPATPPPPPAPPKKVPAPPARRASTSVPVIRRNDGESTASARPKREIHPPPPKDLPYADAPKRPRKRKIKDDGTAEQLRFCGKLLVDLHRKQHWTIAHPFYEPVDPVKLDIPMYPKIIKKPMDMSTMRKKLESGEYPNASKFYDDFKLMIRNCFTFNPHGTPVNQAGTELQRLFDEKWKNLPTLHDVSEEEEEEDVDEEEDDRKRRIATMEAQIESMRGNLLALKNQPGKEKKKKREKEKPIPTSMAKASIARAPKVANISNGPVKKKKKQLPDDDILTFEQKKNLSEAICKLDESRLAKVIQIIHEGVPEVRDSTEEIELEIDLLPPHVLTKLYNFVLRPLRQPVQKRSRASGKGTGTGGLKRKSMDENVEAEKIRQLEERMRLFDPPGAGTGGVATPTGGRLADDDSERSSDSSSDDSSGSESE